jgi:hypothetical protein
VLWCGIVGGPSSAKSPAIAAAFDLVRHAEDRMAQGYEEERARFALAKQVSEATRDVWKAEVKQAISAGHQPPDQPVGATEPEMPFRPRLRVADATIEKMGLLCASLPRGLLLVRDELAGWLGAFDKYGGGGSDRAFAIEMYGGQSYVVDRVKNHEPIMIRHLSVGVLGGVQPDKIALVTDGPDDGLAARLLWAWPDNSPEFNLSRGTLDDMAHRDAFLRLTELQMGSDAYGKPEPVRLPLTREAEDALEEFGRDTLKRSHEAAGIMAGALGKARGHAMRLATVLEFLWWSMTRSEPEPRAISVDAIDGAAGLLDSYYLPMTARVLGDAAIPKAERKAMLLARYIRTNGLREFNARDLRREIGGSIRAAADMDEACAGLVEANIIKPKFTRAGPNPGRSAKRFDVNPAALIRVS